MAMQTFRATTLLTALEDIQRKLGPKAVVVSVRQVPTSLNSEVWRSHDVEVMAMPSTSGSVPAAWEQKLPPPFGSRTADSAGASYKQDKHPASVSQIASPAPLFPAALAKACRWLIEQGIEEEFIEKVIKPGFEALSPRVMNDGAWMHNYLRHQLQASLRVIKEASFLGSGIACLIGFSGSGKTTLAAKLAVHHCQEMGRKVAWICADSVSPGAISEAQLFTTALDIPLHVVNTPAELANALSLCEGVDLILVDTPGCNPYDENSLGQIGDYLTVLSGRGIYLVLAATAKESDLNKALLTFKSFNIKGLMVTKLDETRTFGNIFNLAWRSQLPLSYFSIGRRIPEDLREANAGILVARIFREGWAI